MTDEELMNLELSEAQIQAELERKNAEKLLQLQAELNESKEKFLQLCEEYFSQNGEGELKEIAIERKAKRAEIDALGKIVQTAEGDGTAFNPFKTWNEGMAVKSGEWWQTYDGYLWQAKKDGVPSSSTDAEYWEVV